MVEYGQVVGQGSEAGGSAGGGGPVDVGMSLVHAASDAVARVAALPPTTLLLIAAVVIVGFVLLKRAF